MVACSFGEANPRTIHQKQPPSWCPVLLACPDHFEPWLTGLKGNVFGKTIFDRGRSWYPRASCRCSQQTHPSAVLPQVLPRTRILATETRTKKCPSTKSKLFSSSYNQSYPMILLRTFFLLHLQITIVRSKTHSSFFFASRIPIPSGNQTWQWNLDHLSVFFRIKPPFIEDFPASHV